VRPVVTEEGEQLRVIRLDEHLTSEQRQQKSWEVRQTYQPKIAVNRRHLGKNRAPDERSNLYAVVPGQRPHAEAASRHAGKDRAERRFRNPGSSSPYAYSEGV
jgi:hypothetical protein